MSHYHQHSKFYDLPILLSEEEMKAPLSVIEDFFTDYKLHEVREMNHATLHQCLTVDAPPFENAYERDRLLDYRKREEKVLEAGYLLLQQAALSKPPTTANQPTESKEGGAGGINLGELQDKLVAIHREVTELFCAVASARISLVQKKKED